MIDNTHYWHKYFIDKINTSTKHRGVCVCVVFVFGLFIYGANKSGLIRFIVRSSQLPTLPHPFKVLRTDVCVYAACIHQRWMYNTVSYNSHETTFLTNMMSWLIAKKILDLFWNTFYCTIIFYSKYDKNVYHILVITLNNMCILFTMKFSLIVPCIFVTHCMYLTSVWFSASTCDMNEVSLCGLLQTLVSCYGDGMQMYKHHTE